MAKAADGKQEQMRMRAFTDADGNRKSFAEQGTRSKPKAYEWPLRKAERHSGEVGRFVFCICGFEGIV